MFEIINQSINQIDFLTLLITVTSLGIVTSAIMLIYRFHRFYQTTKFRNLQLQQEVEQLLIQQITLLQQQKALTQEKARADTVYQDLKNYAEELEKTQRASLNILQDMEIAKREAETANRSKSEFLAQHES